MSSFPPSPEPFSSQSPRRLGRDRELSARAPASYPEPPDYPESRETPQYNVPRWMPGPRTLGAWLVVGAILVLVAAALIPTVVGVYVGTQERTANMHRLAESHFQQALKYESENYYELAMAELQIAVKFDPNYQEAADRLETLQKRSNPAAGATPNSAAIADQLWTRAQGTFQQQQWSDAIDYLEEIRRADETYRANEVKSMLVQADLNGGKQSVTMGQIEQARARFGSILALDPENAQAKQLRDRSDLYVSGIEYMSTNPQSAVSSLQQLYTQDPNFADVKKQLMNALIAYGDVATKQGAYCIAYREYDQAVKLGADSSVQTKLTQSNTNCRTAILATPTPTATSVTPGAPGVTGTPTVPGTTSRVGNWTVKTSKDSSGGTCGIIGTIRDAQGNTVSGGNIRIYNDAGYDPAPLPVEANGHYSIVLSDAASLFHLVLLQQNRQPASGVYDFNFPGGNSCRWIIDWTMNP